MTKREKYISTRNRLAVLALFFLMPLVGWGQITPTIDSNGNGTIEDEEKNLYLIQTQQFESFYITPKDNNVNLNTVNLPHSSMLWYFLEAEYDAVNDIHYYYIVNNSTGKYVYNTDYTKNDNNGRLIKLGNLVTNDNTKEFKFYLIQNGTTDYYYIYVKQNNRQWRCLNKQAGNASHANGIRLTNDDYVNNINSRWKFVPYDGTLVWPSPPFSVSTDLEKHYYKIRNKNDATYYISTDQTTNKAIYSNTVNNDIAWYFKEASTEGLLKYYYIINPEANDKYMYYTGNTNTSDKPSALSIKDINDPEAEANRFQFVIVQAAETNVDNPINGYYMIVPRLLVNNLWNSNSIGQKAETDNDLDIILGRENNSTSHWKFETIVYPMSCSTPTITYSSETGKITIATTTPEAVIHYTTDGVTVPSSSVGTEYTGPFDVSSTVTIKAIATKTGYDDSPVETVSFNQVAEPGFELTDDTKVRLTCATDGASIYYAMGNTQPTSVTIDPSNLYSGPIENAAGKYIAAVAVKDGLWINSTLLQTGQITFPCAKPVITKTSATTFTITCSYPTSGVTIYYNTGDGNQADPTSASTEYSGEVTFNESDLPFTVKAIAMASGYENSEVATKTIREELTPDGEGIYHITNQTEFETFVDMASSTDGASYHYVLDANVTAVAEIAEPFTGIFDGNYYTITGLTNPFFNTVDGGIVKNVILDNVTISGGTNVGAICGVATGASRIYNCGVLATGSTVNTDENGYTFLTDCSSTISGSNYVGGLVGLLDGSSRVINCFSYADVSGGSYVGGIVGYNNVATTATNLQTMVMNCMFYGEVSGGSIAPIYNGNIITNVGENTGVSNFNYFRLESSYIQNTDITKVYNCALGAETRFLQRFEFYRHLLNSHLELAGWWATGTYSSSEMMKWVLEPSQIGTSTPYPILKSQGKYPSVVNIDAEHATTGKPRNQGGKLGTLTVNIQMGNGAVYNAPTGAEITTDQLTPNITDKDTALFNYNYYKVQLPYYNDVGTKNYNGNRVVTGWKIVSITGGTAGTYSTGEDVTYTDGVLTKTPYNFADRNCTNKDLYSVSKRVFNQGAYWDVPYGVTAITIEPYWAKCVYLADAYADVVYNQAMGTAYNVPNVGGGQIYTNGNSYPIAEESQKVFTTMGNAIASSNSGLFQGTTGTDSHTVYDYAVVLVGNYHHYYPNENNKKIEASNSKPYTVTSIDLDGDNEPDYSYIMRLDSRQKVHPVRVDFINIPGLGMAQKSTGGTGTYNFGIMQPKNWFESTNTSLFRVTQFEYDCNDRIAAPYILQGGVMEQWVNGQSGGHANKTIYFHVGGNVWFKEFHRGTHQDQNYDANHSPVSVTGGDFDQFHLTGLYTADATICDDNAECYITGGRFRVVAGTGMDGLGTTDGKGNITWIIDNADIKEFYSGSFNADKPAIGNLHTIVNGGHIDLFCGGPKFGDMSSGKTVTTTATACTFGTFFGAGYGGNSYSRQAPRNHNNIINFPHNEGQAGNDASWNAWLSRFYKQEYNSTYGGVSTQFNYQFLPVSGNDKNVARIFVEYVKFSKATTHSVTSNLTDCTILNNFYGGGSLGKVDGTVTSTLESCTVKGNVYGAGFSASTPTVEVDSLKFRIEPYYYEDLGTYRTGVKGQTTTYTWRDTTVTVNSTAIAINKTKKFLYTNEDLKTLGTVTSNVTLTLKGNTTVGTLEGGILKAGTGNVFGGGDESAVSNDTNPANASTTVILQGVATIHGNVYGGGNKGLVSGDSSVTIQATPPPTPPEP